MKLSLSIEKYKFIYTSFLKFITRLIVKALYSCVAGAPYINRLGNLRDIALSLK